jgi:hypothetical protein
MASAPLIKRRIWRSPRRCGATKVNAELTKDN